MSSDYFQESLILEKQTKEPFETARFKGLLERARLQWGRGCQTKIAELLDVSPQTITNWKKGTYPPSKLENDAISQALENDAAKYPASPVRDTIIHEPPRTARESVSEKLAAGADALRARILRYMQLAPIISWARGGEESAFYEDQGHDVPRIAVPCKDPNCYVLELEGNSMEPTYIEGDLLVVAPNLEARSNDLVIVKTEDGKVFFKKMRQPSKGPHLQFLSYNTQHEPIYLLPQEIHKISVVHSVIRPLRERVRAMAISEF